MQVRAGRNGGPLLLFACQFLVGALSLVGKDGRRIAAEIGCSRTHIGHFVIALRQALASRQSRHVPLQRLSTAVSSRGARRLPGPSPVQHFRWLPLGELDRLTTGSNPLPPPGLVAPCPNPASPVPP